MTGLKLLCSLYDVNYSSLAKQMNIDRANVTMWMRDGKIPKGRLTAIQDMFPSVPVEFFTMNITDEDISSIMNLILRNKHGKHGSITVISCGGWKECRNLGIKKNNK